MAFASSWTYLPVIVYMKKIVSVLLISFLFNAVHAQKGRTEIDLSGLAWNIWRDTAATWINDTLYPPPVNPSALPYHPPTVGWKALETVPAVHTTLPATIEQFYWGKNGNAFGLSGNYLGVSWFWTRVFVPASLKSKRLALHFASARFRAEVFINQKLVGYDLVTGTPFDVDITNGVQYGKENLVAVRITDPNGNFDWRDSQNFMWGNYRTNPTHGFGGVTGKVKLVATDAIYIEDVFVKNKPRLNEVDVAITLQNKTTEQTNATLVLRVKESKGGKVVYEKEAPVVQPVGQRRLLYTIAVQRAKLWSVDSPNLYVISISLKSAAASDEEDRRFGFRWFEIRNNKGDQQFFLNGKRIVLRSSISWGFWPVNGITPSDALARKQVETAKKLGLNMLNFHRTIGQENVLDYADEAGLLYFEEPGGNQFPLNLYNATDSMGRMQRDFYFAVRNEKLFRMIRRDRSHPSLIIYNMHNERGAEPQPQDREEMRAAHHLDETRILNYNSSNGDIKQGPDPRFKLHLLPYDTTFYDYGWFDQHHAGGPGTYHNNLYNSPANYLRYTDKKDEIIFYGEEGAIGTPPRLQLIREDIMKTGKNIGWETDSYLRWYNAYDRFLDESGFRKAFPNVDSLTRKMGNVAYYYQGRTIENIRINNTVDGYVVNGWESMKLENHSGIVDNYRNPKGDVDLIARYNRPLYVAVKMNRKVFSVGDTTSIDFFIVNERNINGAFTLAVKALDEKGNIAWRKSIPVKVSGGTQYGELLSAGHMFSPSTDGYTRVVAELVGSTTVVARGEDELYAVRLNTSGMPAKGMVADTTGTLLNYFKSVGLNSVKPYTGGRPEGDYLVIGAFEPQQTGNPLVTDILEWVNEGNTLIVVNNSEHWADHLAKKEVLDYRGTKLLGTTWYGGNFFSKQHPLFNGLPQAVVFNWEYQCFATYNRSRSGMRLFNGETIVAAVADHKPEVYSALSIVPHGRGKIILCALDIFSCIKDVKTVTRPEGDGENAAMNTFNNSQKNSANVVGQQLLLNMIKYAGPGHGNNVSAGTGPVTGNSESL